MKQKLQMGKKMRRLFCMLAAACMLVSGAAAAGPMTDQLPVLMYHHLKEDPGTSTMIVSPARFAEQMQALAQAGYTAVTPTQIIDYVDNGTPLPEKPVWITFDDGYQSNLDYAAPVLEQNGLRATIYVIGVSVGKSTYKDMGVPIIPHFSFAAAQPWVEKGIVTIQSHTYDMHHVISLDADHYRRGVLPRDNESLDEYMDTFRKDFSHSKQDIVEGIGGEVVAFAYPYGLHNALTEGMLREMGIRLTVTTRPGINTLTQGDPTCLYGMSRFNITQNMTGEQLLEKIRES